MIYMPFIKKKLHSIINFTELTKISSKMPLKTTKESNIFNHPFQLVSMKYNTELFIYLDPIYIYICIVNVISSHVLITLDVGLLQWSVVEVFNTHI